MRKIFFILFIFFCARHASAQFISKGLIEFERKTNQHAMMDENSIWDAAAMKTTPQFVTSYFDLRFDNGHTSYKPGREPAVKQQKFWGIFPAENQVAMNLDSNTLAMSKSIEGNNFLINDSLNKITWKIGSDTRTIAGFECRKAVGKIFDSVVVVAFYTDEIVPSGGPESFSGLPGMILGVAIPRLHTTWYATKLQLVDVSSKDLEIPKKGKKMSMPEFKKQVNTLFNSQEDPHLEEKKWQTIL
ncbi:MAG: GLPGLI family protein [Chitinophagaceae bacterium]